eukprot:CAMPEP_0171461908 /NCGR_PEP_ID=MMETSP0945-20130129/6160_1 /TAXON_ID=109269 /ORGANISM="Vaucheria litorea, Strain CCMP2940" /LENGTH=387 /DNA_ID=CAMNT_0011988333 /DNA_START=32 /DNA_END=1192 /DNA_ORIENTATION=-
MNFGTRDRIDSSTKLNSPSVGLSDASNKNNESLMGIFSTNRRRFNEKIGQKLLGKDKSEDGSFEKKYAETKELQMKMNNVKVCLKSLHDSTRSFCQRSVDLSNACNDSDARDDEFVQVQLKLEALMRESLDKKVMEALESLELKLAPFKDLDEKVKIRNDLKLDYDHYVRKVRDLKEKPGMDPAKIVNNEQKLEAARIAVHNATLGCYKAFNYYSEIGGRIVSPEIEMFKAAQVAYIEGAHSCIEGIKLKDINQLSEELERVGLDGTKRVILTGYEGTFFDSVKANWMERSPSSNAPIPPNENLEIANKTLNSASTITTVPWGQNNKEPSKSGAWWEQRSEKRFDIPVAPPSNTCKALFDYSAADHTEISLKEGDIIEILKKDDSGW